MTFTFIQAIERGHAATYGSILNSMRSSIRNAGEEMSGGVVTSLITMLLTGGSLSGGMRQVSFNLLHGLPNFSDTFACILKVPLFTSTSLRFQTQGKVGLQFFYSFWVLCCATSNMLFY